MAAVGSSSSFSVAVGGLGPFGYKWYFAGTNLIQSGTNNTLNLSGVATNNVGNYTVVITNAYGSVTSQVATLSVYYFSQKPPNQMGTNVGAASFGVVMFPPGAFIYQWQFNSVNLPTNGTSSTVAGNGGTSFSGDGGIATSASLYTPYGTAVDGAGNIYIADRNNNRIRKVANNDIITTVAGKSGSGYSGDGGAATDALLYYPSSVAVDGLGNLFIADYNNNRIRKVDANGIITTVAGKGTSGFSGDGNHATNAMLYNPSGVAVDNAGNLFIADYNNNRVRKVNTKGVITTVAGTGVSGFAGDGSLAASAALYHPAAVAVDVLGNLFIADYSNYRVRTVNTNGYITTFAGKGNSGFSGDGGAATNASLNYPDGVVIDGVGNVFIADYQNYRVREVYPNGVISTVAGNGTFTGPDWSGIPTGGCLVFVRGVTVDRGNNIFIADNYRIRKIVGNPIYPPTQPALTIGNLSAINAGNYSVVIHNAGGSITSSVVTLTVQTPPAFIVQPVSQMVAVGSNPSFTVAAVGSGPFGYALYFAGTNLLQSGTNSTLALSGVTTNYTGSYTVVITNAYGSVTSQIATLIVVLPPTIAFQPASQTNLAGATVGFGVTASGVGQFSYQWQLNGTNLPNNTITTVAGGGSVSPGDGGFATNAHLNFPCGLAFDASGNLYIADADNDRIRKVDTNGIITTVAGTGYPGSSGDVGPATNASLYFCTGVTVDSSGELIISDEENKIVRKVNSNGVITTIFGGSQMPRETFDSAGNLYVSSVNPNCIYKLNNNNAAVTVAGVGLAGFGGDGGPAVQAALNYPVGMAFSSQGNLFFCDAGYNRVREVDGRGIITTAAGGGSHLGDSGFATNASLSFPQQVAFDRAGNLFISDYSDNRVRMVDTNGIITTIVGGGTYQPGYGDGGAATNAVLNEPVGVAFDAPGNLFISDAGYNRVREIQFAGFPTLPLTNISSTNSGNYSVIVSTPYGSVTSLVASLTVVLPPQIIASGINFGFTINLANQTGFGFNLRGTSNQTIVVEGSTNLLDWTPLYTNLANVIPAYFFDPASTNFPSRFYRATLSQ